ncbi:MAG TPA: hypothetical protein VHA12_00610 [Candidatus Nanoarchaeia archaeon]|nr:hypothetical protein [Candidatus Nanoarchaeia archaeon]
MNKKANVLTENIMYLILLAFFVLLIWGFLFNRANSSALWEDFYAKELARVVDSSQAGDVLRLEVQKATSIAKRNGIDIQEAGNMFLFDAKNRRICVQLSVSGGKCYPYFNDVIVTQTSMELGVPQNFLNFKIEKRTENENE